ncbi:hypothetical protein [Glycomyces arizonensis]|uniref:hypothetical protein n=1 Tax=Glycomyces arizonensis TaxID=256035 RepID=UPI0012EB5301|nr:hypothetical protein [Glycomyces arizonensis]
MEEFQRADRIELSKRQGIASRVSGVLKDAGLPVPTDVELERGPGAVIEVDPGEDAAGGVYITWHVGPELDDRNNRRLLAGELLHDEIGFAGHVSESMMNAIVEILSFKRFDVEVSDEEIRPYSIKVHGGPQADDGI